MEECRNHSLLDEPLLFFNMEQVFDCNKSLPWFDITRECAKNLVVSFEPEQIGTIMVDLINHLYYGAEIPKYEFKPMNGMFLQLIDVIERKNIEPIKKMKEGGKKGAEAKKAKQEEKNTASQSDDVAPIVELKKPIDEQRAMDNYSLEDVATYFNMDLDDYYNLLPIMRWSREEEFRRDRNLVKLNDLGYKYNDMR